ncbi:hypothetical protein BFJ70_g2356 [Fusarium oxysporum]|uniref:Uncharacterized protein n=1 Tax=Fusarium oxysporum Fo47 TaxID=660027 RepID=W9JWT1_FUSOX|nr:hypothetical protein FOZG_12122 [Fusarium oxysporum Fo47]RKL47993.1 hypothetical protein BFJ70_g2356 [Fusarium oxysporum]
MSNTRVELPAFLAEVRDAVLEDPGLPRDSPTVSLWQEPPHPTVASIQSATIPQQTDFIVIGSGITGCSVIKTLLEQSGHGDNHKASHITLLEARTLVSGATGRNGGHLVTSAGHTYAYLADKFGEQNAKEITRFSIMNINYILKMVREMDPELQEYSQIRNLIKVMVAQDAAMWASSKKSVQDFQKAVEEYKTYHRIIEKGDVAERWNVKDGFGAIEHPAGAVWPYRLLTGIYARLLEKYPERLAVEANTPVIDIKYDPIVNEYPNQYPYTIITPRGNIRAGQVIHCTNAFASHLLPPLRGKVYPFRGTMSVQRAGSALKNKGDFRSWSGINQELLDPETRMYQSGLYYLQQNGRTGDLWLGTETSYLRDILNSDDTYVTPESWEALSRFLPNYFSEGWNKSEPAQMKGIWSGIQGHTADDLPLVGKIPEKVTGRPGSTGEWIAAGFNGYGMDKCWLTGEALAKMALGRQVDDWFPKCYYITEARVEQAMCMAAVLAKFDSISKKAQAPAKGKL